jgi:hypothetical protein
MVAFEVAPCAGDGYGGETPTWTEDIYRPGHATVIEIADMNTYSPPQDETLGLAHFDWQKLYLEYHL